MRYVIRELSHVEGTDLYYVLVEFYEPGDGRTPSAKNDFLMQLADETTVLDNRNRPMPIKLDVPAIVDANIRAYWERAQKRGELGDRTDARIRRDAQDPKGVLARDDVRALPGVRR